MANRLAGEASAYLRSAAHQPVDWYPWSEEAFERARREDKPILLDIGAVWCHWCHVIDQESYDDPAVAEIINKHFVAIKVDRDARPDIDARYQQAVSAITGQGGWPLTGFLTPDGLLFYGGTYFPPQDAYGRPGFKRVLLSVAAHYRENRDEALRAAAQLHQQLARTEERGGTGRVDPSLLSVGLESIRRLYDPQHGGFGGAPKFPHPSAVEFLLRRYSRTGDEALLDMVVRTLEKMARGGIHDQLGGGFHRYATDARWIVPHFEKMLADNAALLANYVHAFQATGRTSLAAVAADTAAFVAEVLYDHGGGGFLGSQDADVAPGDDGSYFTWTEEEARAALSAEEFAVLAEHYHLLGRGELHGDGRHVLFVDRDPDVIAAITGRPLEEVQQLLASGRAALRAARRARRAPYVDTALYAGWNGMAISAFLDAAVALDEPRYRTLALWALDRFLTEAYTPGSGFVHVPGGRHRFLDDQAQMGQALLDAYEVTGDARYLRLARETAEAMLQHYWDGAGFVDVPKGAAGPGLSRPHRPVQDAPTPGANAVAARVLLRLARLLDDSRYRDTAGQILNAYAPALAPHGLFASTLLLAVDDFLHEPTHVTIVGAPDDPRTARLHRAALRAYRPDRLISLHAPDGADGGVALPDVVRAMRAATTEPTAYVCAGTACAAPTTDPQTLSETIRTFGRK